MNMNTATSLRLECTRRQFVGSAAAVWATINILPSRLLGADAPSKKTTLAGVGIGGVGHGQLKELASAGFQIAALCDVDDSYGAKTFDLWPQARRYRDFRDLLASEGDQIDAVYCGTPDHTHALITLAALRRKKHVCCVKPLTRTIHELRIVVEAARKVGVATQVTAAPNTDEAGCRATEIIQGGGIGAVREVHLWSNRPVWPQGMMRPAGEDPVPDKFDWKLWLGPAELRPFKADWPADHYALKQMNIREWDPGIKAVYHPFNFRGWWDFGSGALGDMGCHHFNTPFRALKLGAPIRIQASASKVFAESAPLAAIVTLDFPARGELPPVRAAWYDGGLKPATRRELGGTPLPSEGTLYIGEEGALLGTWEGLKIGPDPAAKRCESIPKTLPRRPGTWKEWLIACQGGQPAGCNFDLAGPLTEAVLLGNVAIRADRPLDWDSAQMRVTNFDPANDFVREAYKNGWSLEESGR